MASVAHAALLVLSLATVVAYGVALKLFGDLFDNIVDPLLGFHKDSLLNFTTLSGQYDFASEEHTVTTEDGYILTIFRMRSKDCVEFKRTPVILMHGLFQSADAWLDAGPDAGLAYLIAGECRDLWVGNQRGNRYARRHVSLDADKDTKFWKFSIDEIGFYDIPATIDYVLKYTGAEKLNYVGFSQGGGTFFIMCSERPGYSDKVNVLVALAPATRITNTKSVGLRNIFISVRELEGVLSATGFHEVFSKGALVNELLGFLCQFRSTLQAICGTTFGILDSFHPGSIETKTLQVMSEHTPAGTSIHTLARYGQGLRTDKFQKFDYGEVRNLEYYGAEQPPSYNLAAVTVPVVLLYGRNDHFVDIEDLFWLVKELPDVVEAREVADPLWNHLDMVYSRNIKKMLFPKLNQYLLKYSNKKYI